MTTSLYIDSRYRALGTPSNFTYQLVESLNLHGARMRIDAVRFTDSFYTIEETNQHLYFKGAGKHVGPLHPTSHGVQWGASCGTVAVPHWPHDFLQRSHG